MDPSQFFLFVKRHAYILLIAVIISAIAGFVVHQKNTKTFAESTLFATVGAKSDDLQKEDSPYEMIQAANDFSETIQGWTKNPRIQTLFNQEAGFSLDVSAIKQEKQNLVFSIKTDTKEHAEKGSDAVVNVLKNEIAKYNQDTQGDFILTLPSSTVEMKTSASKFTIPFIMIVVLVLMLLGLFLKEYMAGEVSFASEIEEILGTPAIETFGKKDDIKRVDTYLKSTSAPILIATMPLSKSMQEKHHMNIWPDVEVKTSNPNIAVLIKLGKTKRKTLQQMKTLLTNAHFYPFIIA